MLVDIPKDIVDPKNPHSAMDWYWPTDDEHRPGLPGYKPTTKGHPRKIKEAAELILQSRRPVIYAGGGILKARAAEALRELAELVDIHVVTTLMARGAFPDDHPLCLGMPGMHGNYTAVTSMQQADLLIALGSRFDDRVTGKVPAFAPDAKIIHVDIDPAELGKVRRPDVPIVGDCRLVIEELVKAVRDLGGREAQPDRSAWKQTISGWQENFPLTYEQSEPGDALKPQYVLEQLRDSRPTTASSVAASASTRCGRRSTGSSTTPTRGSTRAASARWASPCPPRSAPRSAGPTAWCGPSTATAASR